MKITAVAPIGIFPDEIERRRRNLETLCSRGTSIKVVGIEGMTSVDDASSRELMVPGVVRRAQEAEKEGADAFVIHCFGDPGLEEARRAVNIPVVGACQTIFHVACLLANRFAIVSRHDDTQVEPGLIEKYGMASRVVSRGRKGLNIPVLELHQRKEELQAKFVESAKKAVDEGAELIISGCLAILPTLGPGSAVRLTEMIGVPVLDSSGIALRMAELLVNMKLSHSKKAFPKASVKLSYV